MVMWQAAVDYYEGSHIDFYGTTFRRPVVCITYIRRGVFILAILAGLLAVCMAGLCGTFGGCGP